MMSRTNTMRHQCLIIYSLVERVAAWEIASRNHLVDGIGLNCEARSALNLKSHSHAAPTEREMTNENDPRNFLHFSNLIDFKQPWNL